MSDSSAIEWTDATWNPVSGCSRVSDGCRNCYAEALSHRFGWTTKTWSHVNAVENVRLHEERLDAPLHWRKPRRVFVNSMSDLFHEQVPDAFIKRVWQTMRAASRHTFQVLTKRPERMRAFVQRYYPEALFSSNVWLGVSVENQRAADERIPLLLQTPAAVRFLSCEPLLEMVNIAPYLGLEEGEPEYPWEPVSYERVEPSGISWVIIGGESGPKARPMNEAWAYYLVQQCQAAGVAPFVKQMGQVWARQHGCKERHAGLMEEWPEHLRVREWPDSRVTVEA